MISTHIQNKICHLICTSPDKHCAVNICISYICKIKYVIFEEVGHVAQVIGYTVIHRCAWSKCKCPLHERTLQWKSFTPLVNSVSIMSWSVNIAPDLNQPLFQHIDMILNCNCPPYLIVNCVEVWSVWRSEIQQNKVWSISTEQFDSIASAMCRCVVLLKRV